jgi:hypothetical protein
VPIAVLTRHIGVLGGLSAALAAAATPASAATRVDPMSCTGYPQARQFVESQAWWTRTPGRSGTDFGHLHLGACIPERERMRRPQRLDVRVMMHHNPGRMKYVSLVVKGREYERTVAKRRLDGFTCPTGTCARWTRFRLRPRQFERSGLQEVRFRAFVEEPDGNEMHTSINWQVDVRNGRPRSPVTRRPYLRGKGWYTGAGYCEAAYRSVPLPDAPLGRRWTPTLAMVWDGDDEDLPVTHHTARLDPDLHAGIPGTILRDGNGPWLGAQPIDLGPLTPGRHKLVLRSDCEDPRGSTNAGVLVIGFDVRR